MTKKISRRLREAIAKVDDTKAYEPLEALNLLKETATAKFEETAEAHIRLGIDPKYTDQQLRTTVSFPKGTGQTVRVAVIARGEKVQEANSAGADIVGSEELIDEIQGGMLDFEVLIATPDMMPKELRRCATTACESDHGTHDTMSPVSQESGQLRRRNPMYVTCPGPSVSTNPNRLAEHAQDSNG